MEKNKQNTFAHGPFAFCVWHHAISRSVLLARSTYLIYFQRAAHLKVVYHRCRGLIFEIKIKGVNHFAAARRKYLRIEGP